MISFAYVLAVAYTLDIDSANGCAHDGAGLAWRESEVLDLLFAVLAGHAPPKRKSIENEHVRYQFRSFCDYAETKNEHWQCMPDRGRG